MYPPTWGPLFHDILLFLAIGFPEEPTEAQQKSMRSLLVNLFANLPCASCMVQASVYAQMQPPAVESSSALRAWVVKLHNHINAKLGKKADWAVVDAEASFHERHFSHVAYFGRVEQKRLEDHRLLRTCSVEIRRLTDLNTALAQELQACCEPGTPVPERCGTETDEVAPSPWELGCKATGVVIAVITLVLIAISVVVVVLAKKRTVVKPG